MSGQSAVSTTGHDWLAKSAHLWRGVLAAAGYNFRRLLAWLRLLLAWMTYTLSASNKLHLA